ncbi:MAG TPA: 30S ribosomal protein S12 methylthiotransferase RimO [Lachnospiraceae bacterium]|nr:30S ribosomal protein S12 methylthiotransferase RimO [Lachnospiraceae bacterium]
MNELKVYFSSLGCDKNLVDSEKMMSVLLSHGISFTDDETDADIIVINTCGFILDAKQESIETILELARMKTSGRAKALVVTGCLAQRYSEEIRAEIPEVDAVVGTSGYDSIWEAVEQALAGERPDIFKDTDYMPKGMYSRVRSGFGPHRYLKIAEGCDKHCTYCAIPMMRGRYRSVPMEELVREAGLLAEDGATELIIVAQETTLYGVDLYGEKKLPELLHKLCQIDGIEWIRLLYCYPEEISEELIQTMRDEPKLCHYLDIPIQHANDEILRRMGRKTDKQSIVSTIGMIRRIIPDVAIRTTLISGFPGETKAMHEELIDFIKELRFDRLGVFPYSEEEGTPAAEFPDQVPVDERKRRADELMRISEQIIFEKNKEMPGRSLPVIVEGYLPEENRYVGRSYRDAPDIDGLVFFTSDNERLTSEIVWVTIDEASGYDLVGEERRIS